MASAEMVKVLFSCNEHDMRPFKCLCPAALQARMYLWQYLRMLTYNIELHHATSCCLNHSLVLFAPHRKTKRNIHMLNLCFVIFANMLLDDLLVITV